MTLREVSSRVRTVKGTMAESTLSRIEENQNLPSWEVAAQLCKELDIDMKTMQDRIILKRMDRVSVPAKKTTDIEVYETITLLPKKKKDTRRK